MKIAKLQGYVPGQYIYKYMIQDPYRNGCVSPPNFQEEIKQVTDIDKACGGWTQHAGFMAKLLTENGPDSAQVSNWTSRHITYPLSVWPRPI